MNAPTHPASTATGPDYRAIITPSLSRVLVMRGRQLEHGHDAEADDATGTAALTRMAYNKLLLAEQKHLTKATNELRRVLDDSSGHLHCLDDRQLATLDKCLATAAALTIAAMDTLDRFRERRNQEQGQ
jgi:hypothetical protein